MRENLHPPESFNHLNRDETHSIVTFTASSIPPNAEDESEYVVLFALYGVCFVPCGLPQCPFRQDCLGLVVWRSCNLKWRRHRVHTCVVSSSERETDCNDANGGQGSRDGPSGAEGIKENEEDTEEDRDEVWGDEEGDDDDAKRETDELRADEGWNGFLADGRTARSPREELVSEWTPGDPVTP